MMKRSFFAAAVCVSALFAACSEKMETEEALLAEQREAVIEDEPATRAVASNGAWMAGWMTRLRSRGFPFQGLTTR